MRYEALGDLFTVAGGTFYRYIKGEGVKDLLHNIHVSNGLAWNEKDKKFYFIDSVKYDVKEFDYDMKTGEICTYNICANLNHRLNCNWLFSDYFIANPRVVYDFRVGGKEPEFVPDGMTIDAEGNLYVATWAGSKVIKIDPR